jgi:hypothetical protein
MSRKTNVSTWQRELYTDVYSWIREFHRYGNTTPFKKVLVGTMERQTIFGKALISYQNRGAEFSGWRNPLLGRYFANRNPKAGMYSDIPF